MAQFKDTVTLHSTSKNQYGEEQVISSQPMKCAILKRSRTSSVASKNAQFKYDMHILIPYKRQAPYNELDDYENRVIEYEGLRYRIATFDAYHGNGKPKLYDIKLVIQKD